MNQKRLAEYVKKVGPSILFPSTVTNISVGDIYKLNMQGLSTKMYAFSLTYSLGGHIFKDSFILRVYKGHAKEKWLREYAALRTLKAQGIAVPMVFALETDTKTIGQPFMIMEKIDGLSASHFFSDEENALAMVNMLAKTLASVHQLDSTVLLKYGEFKNQSEFTKEMLSKIENLINVRYVTNLSPFRRKKYLDAIKKLKEVKTKQFRPTVVHGDFGPDHVLVTERGPVIVDWEGISLGDPAYDVGWVYHILMLEGQTMIDHRFVKLERQKTFHEDLREQFVKCYENRIGGKLTNLEFYKDLAAIRLAALFDLYLRPGLMTFLGNLRLIGPKRTFTQTLFMRSEIKSFHDYCTRFLENRGILST